MSIIRRLTPEDSADRSHQQEKLDVDQSATSEFEGRA